MRRLLLLLGVLLSGGVSCAPGGARLSPALIGDEGAAAAKALRDLFEAEWDYEMEAHPTVASALGDRRWNDRWEERTEAKIEARHTHKREVLARLAAIDPVRLHPRDQLNYALFRKETEQSIQLHELRWHLLPVNQRSGLQAADEFADRLRFETVKDYQDWIARLRSFPKYAEETTALMREGARKGLIHPRVVLDRVPAQIDKQLVEDPVSSPFYKPFRRFPPSIAEPERARLRQAGAEAIRAAVVPAHRRFKKFLVEEYLPAATEKAGLWQLPGGERAYAFFVRQNTTTDLSPQAIHELGQSEVARIRREMQAVMARTGFKGTLSDFQTFLRTDPRFYYRSAEELLAAYRAIAKRIDPRLVTIFRTLPRMPYGVDPIPDALAPDTTTAYYQRPAADGSRAGTYYVNLYKPEARPKFEMMALSLHEAVPGHHFQIALAMEQGEIPKFRRYGGFTAFVEGWGLYAESLGDEMGLYDDPYDKFGQLTYEMWRAVRLVVDTGMHAFRWDRQRAISFFLDNTAKQELDVVNEIDRYIVMPGQALAYKIGELKMKELRARAREQLGKRFDLREFHEILLRNGAVPLDALEADVLDWLKERG